VVHPTALALALELLLALGNRQPITAVYAETAQIMNPRPREAGERAG